MTSVSRRYLIGGAVAAVVTPGIAIARQAAAENWSLPIREADGLPGNGFVIRDGFACENTWFNPGWWHTAEDWYRDANAETAGAEVIAVHAGQVVWIGSNYPGRVVLVQHPDGLIAMYGHLDFALEVAEGDAVVAGQVIGRVHAWPDARAPSHLHFELRTFVTTTVVNGDSPAYGYACGVQCPPGPGYWPIADPRHPTELGWRNPSHVIMAGYATGNIPDGIVPTGANGRVVTVHEQPDGASGVVHEMTLQAGNRFRVREIDVGDPASTETSAYGYRVWYRLDVGWVRALAPDAMEVGADGRPSTVRPVLLPMVTS